MTPLGAAALRRLLDSLFGSGVFTQATAARLLRRSAGNPLIVEELVRALLRDEILVATGQGWVLADDDMTLASPAISGDRLLIRTAARVYCIRKETKK